MNISLVMVFCQLERVRGIEPLSSAWKAEVIPVYDTRLQWIVGEPGIEPGLSAPKADVLPVYYSPVNYIKLYFNPLIQPMTL